tara:strand:- start:267 stop:446 length:180 start_codon:yes stop_codon:yes gene_type:complete
MIDTMFTAIRRHPNHHGCACVFLSYKAAVIRTICLPKDGHSLGFLVAQFALTSDKDEIY